MFPWELRLMVLARAQGERRQQYFLAAMTANLMNVHLGRGHTVTVDDVLGKPRGRRLSEMGGAERKEIAQKLAEQARERGKQKAQAAPGL